MAEVTHPLGRSYRTLLAIKAEQEAKEIEARRLNKIKLMRRGAIPMEYQLWLR